MFLHLQIFGGWKNTVDEVLVPYKMDGITEEAGKGTSCHHPLPSSLSAALCLPVLIWLLLGFIGGAKTGRGGCKLEERLEAPPLGKDSHRGIALQQLSLEFLCMRCDCLNPVHSPNNPIYYLLPMVNHEHEQEALKSHLTWRHNMYLKAPFGSPNA